MLPIEPLGLRTPPETPPPFAPDGLSRRFDIQRQIFENGPWRFDDHRQRTVFPDHRCRLLHARSKLRRPRSLGEVGVGRDNMNHPLAEKSACKALHLPSEVPQDTPRRYLTQRAASHDALQQARVHLEDLNALGMGQDGRQPLQLKTRQNVIRVVRCSEKGQLHQDVA